MPKFWQGFKAVHSNFPASQCLSFAGSNGCGAYMVDNYLAAMGLRILVKRMRPTR